MDRDTKDTPGVRGRGTTHSVPPRVVSGSILLRDTFTLASPAAILIHTDAYYVIPRVIFPDLIVPRPFGVLVVLVLVIVVIIVVVCNCEYSYSSEIE